MTPRRDAKFGHHNARSQSLDCRLTIDEKMPNGLDVLAALGLRLLRFLTGWAQQQNSTDDRYAKIAQPLSCTIVHEGRWRAHVISEMHQYAQE
jgi:hypothetical protein